MAYEALEKILGYTTLTGLIQVTTDGIPSVLPEQMLKGTRNVIRDAGHYTLVKGQRKLARAKDYAAPTVAAPLERIGTRPVKLLSFGEHQDFYIAEHFQALRKYASYDPQKIGNDEWMRQVDLFKRKFDNARTAVATLALAKGKIKLDSDGNILDPATVSPFHEVSLGIPASNFDQLAIDGGSDVITTPWSNPEANIPQMVLNLKQNAIQEHGYEPMCALYGRKVPTYLSQNAYVNSYMSRNPSKNEEFLSNNTVPDGLLDLNWIPGWKAFYEDANGTNRTIVGDDDVIFFPKCEGAELNDWWEMLEGTTPIPTTVNIQNEMSSVLSTFREVVGRFSYGHVILDVPRIRIVAGDVFLPVLRIPSAVYPATVAGF